MKKFFVKMNKIFKENKIIISIIIASIAYFSICISKVLKPYNIYSWLLYFGLIILCVKTDIFSKKMEKESIILSILFSFIIVYGDVAYKLIYNRELSLFRELITIKNFIKLIGGFNLLFIILKNILVLLDDFTLSKCNSKINKKWVIFLISFVALLLAWLPYFLGFFPGALSYDSIKELSIVINNFTSVSDHHPVIHMLFIALPYNIGLKIFGNITAAVALSTIFQMVSMSAIFSSFIVFLHKRRVNDYLLLLVLLYFAFVPMHGFYSIVMWKDVIFGGSLLLLTMESIKIIEKEKDNKLNFKNMISFILVSILCVFFRNNAIYMYFIFALVSFVIFRKYFKVFAISFCIVFGTYIIVKGPIFNYLNVAKSASAEYIGMPLQQIGRMAFKHVEFTKDEKELIDKLIPVEIMSNSYKPNVSDGIKFNKNYNSKAFDENKLEYLKLYLKLVYKHPDVALEAYTISTLGYWYPNLKYWSTIKDILKNEYNLETKPKLPLNVQKAIIKLESRNLPILNMEWSIGLVFWVILIFAMMSIRKNKLYGIYPFIPIIGIWITMMIASPVFGEFRYVYGAYTCLPLLMLCPYLLNKFKNKN